MKNILMAALLVGAPSAASAGPYFRVGLDSVKFGVFQQIGGPRQETGFVVPVFVHDKADGYLIVPGITWDLLDLGYSQEKDPKGRLIRSARVGPSVNLEEPVKAGLRWACQYLPGWKEERASYAILRGAFAEGPGGALALGPSFRLDMPTAEPKSWRTGVDYAVTLNKRFGGPAE